MGVHEKSLNQTASFSGIFVNTSFNSTVSRSEVKNYLPQECPPAPCNFVDRWNERNKLIEVFEKEPCKVVLVSGLPGIGKSSLVEQWVGETASKCFSDGVIYVDLDTYRQGGAVPLTSILRDKLKNWVDPSAVDTRTDADLVSFYRTVTRNKNMLVFLDDVCNREELKPFIPVSSDGMLVATLSAKRLFGFEHDGFQECDVAPLDKVDSYDLFCKVVEKSCVAIPSIHSRAMKDLLEACGGFPFAIKVAACSFRKRPVEDELFRLAQKRKELFLEAKYLGVLDSVISSLSPVQKGALECIGLLQMPRITIQSFTALCGVDEEEGQTLAFGLADCGLVDLVSKSGQDYCGDLELVFASPVLAFLEYGNVFSTDSSVRDLPKRSLEYLRDLSEEMDYALKPSRLRTYPKRGSSCLVENYVRSMPVYVVFERERDLFSRVLRNWGQIGELADLVWPIAEAMWSFYNTERLYAAGLELLEKSADALRSSASKMAVSRSLMLRANLLAKLGKLEEARNMLREAGEIVEQQCHCQTKLEIELEASFYEFLGSLESKCGNHSLSISHYRRSIGLSNQFQCEEWNFGRAILIQCKHLAIEYETIGDFDKATEYFKQALSLCESVEAHSAAGIQLLAARYFARIGLWGKAKKLAEKSLPYYCKNEEHYHEACTRLLLGRACKEAYEDKEALKHVRKAYTLFRDDHLEKECKEAKSIIDDLNHPLPVRLLRSVLRQVEERRRRD